MYSLCPMCVFHPMSLVDPLNLLHVNILILEIFLKNKDSGGNKSILVRRNESRVKKRQLRRKKYEDNEKATYNKGAFERNVQNLKGIFLKYICFVIYIILVFMLGL